MEDIKRFTVTIEKDTDGTYVAYNVNGDGYAISGRGASVEEARKAFLDTMRETAEYEAGESGRAAEILTAEPEFKFDVASLFDYYKTINMSAFAKSIGLNDSLLRHNKKGGVYISDAQLAKIEDGIHRLGKELSALRLL